MEFYNERLLPKGLPEIIAQMVPHDIYPTTKVIAYHRKCREPWQRGFGVAGQTYYDNLTDSFRIDLYPTVCCHYGLTSRYSCFSTYPGTTSFRLWAAMLGVALHEIGHLAMGHLSKDDLNCYQDAYHMYFIDEPQANRWKDYALAKILTVSPRLGQPSGHLTGYPGVIAHRICERGVNMTERCSRYVLDEFRAMKCDAQVPLWEIIDRLIDWRAFYDYCKQHRIDTASKSPQKVQLLACCKRRVRRDIHRVAKQMGITRYAPSKRPGYRFLMFNAAEAQAVSSALRGRQWPIGPPRSIRNTARG